VSLAAGGSRITTYAWDGNGNLASKTEPGKVTLYRFGPQSRLIDIRIGATQAEAQAAVPNITYSYDASGNRVRKGGAQAASYLIDGSYRYAQVALETNGVDSTAYVRGLQLTRQKHLNSSAAQDLLPLNGHLGTSLGAIDADGNAVEQVDVDAFGNPDHTIGLKQAHLYAGEYWDQDAQLLYLRARWYDPRIGRFISGDPFEGKQRDPRSLNRYAYAHSDPIHGSDPSGRMTLGEVGTTLNIVGNLASRAMTGYSLYQAATGEGDLPVPAFLWGPVFLMEAAGAASEILSLATGPGGGGPLGLPPERHHTIPEYLCGHKSQKLVSLPFQEHSLLHIEMDKFGDIMEKMGKRAASKVMPSRQNQISKMTVHGFGKFPAGRAGIVAGLAGFYTLFDWWSAGIVDLRRNRGGAPTIEAAFWPEAERFVFQGHTSCK
jgi:RHS repeat-associated protein